MQLGILKKVFLGLSEYMNKIVAAKVDARWIDPKTGNSTAAGSLLNTGTQSFSTPEGWEDAILILESSGS
jgi:hypothetical protein